MKIFCVGRNYAEHAKELNNEVPDEPVIFLKPKSALLQPGTHFYYPEFTNELHYEAELVLRVSKNGKYVPDYAAANYFNAITVGIDFTARDIQQELKKKGLPWEKAKAWDNSALVGEWIETTPAMLKNPIHFSMKLNGETVQTGDSRQMLFNFGKIIANVSQYFSLNIGDLIFTGTPAGVGECVVGDEMIGYFENRKVFSLLVK
ncbi:fumarylacetoacetate hydrolase family protein [Limnovirga soli]|jgi:2-keto-4-pentenoate hydratase/2-oxohepta-3-ene-1,7-dioic acid hydratase in catechol pathway|uniref:2-hydroxyhepta-2,4-diene-1,7-dioate isomerase n=1 Tax=Limnovirga soli TaxID=2656915 RepID=A0A8J8JUK5_9BACT|nr:fumarylacetoacetate hydrolase family protein [Limnovirga soli]NNV55654.1 2-hydroxyhepta-2,4-diene-1,7-dioate isomerase [Limnovirga soli]